MLRWLNPINSLAGRIFVWFWLVLLSTVFLTLVFSGSLSEPTDIRRLPAPLNQQLQRQIAPLAQSVDRASLLQQLAQDQSSRWLVVNNTDQQLLNPEALPPRFDPHWLTELAQLNRPRLLRHRNVYLAGPFVIEVAGQQLALYQQRQRPQRAWWSMRALSEPVLILLLLAVSATASFILAVSISRPLRELLQQNLSFASGKLNSRVSRLAKRRDELGQLGRSFNTMAERISDLLQNQQRLLRDISHELRSPLTRAQLALGLAEQQQNLQQLPRLKQELERIDAMLDELLTFSRLDAGQYQLDISKCDLTAMLAELIELNRVEADSKQQRLQLDAPEQLWLDADGRLLSRALENILRNAIKYSPSDSTIRLSLQQQPQQLVLEICDQGPGLPETELAAVFQPFYRVSDSRTQQTGGTGLGLAIVAKIVHQHNGTVQAFNRAPGLCVQVKLPRVATTKMTQPL
ncbi:HAMP domain-containing histidine kinase [Arsukibacterium perlucidum]|uniref:HAMP domain-containing histidine kinase n=1 Tax=Arsukibacterium perlucidum TaxID=368811 RepID=UPI0003699EF1|nr:HAMP domain-containing histidine kinase [Arsukibacterium perlucidum]